MKRSIAAGTLSFLAVFAHAEESYATLRNGARVAITDVSAAGIALAADRGKGPKLESLSQVRSVEGPLQAKFEANRGLANDLRRASTRLSRGDEAGAEPLFEKLWTSSSGVPGPTRAEIAAGLAACRIRRGASATAIEPWVEWIRRTGELSPEQLENQRTVLGISEPGSYWIDAIPPVWSDSTPVRTLAAASVATNQAGGAHPSGDDIALIYTVAARRDSGMPWQIDPAKAVKSPTWANLAGEMVLAESDAPEVRAEARQRLLARLGSDVPLWKQMWIRLAVGRSLLHESDSDDRRAGVLNLLWIASRPEGTPSIVTQAIASATKALAALSDYEGARSLLADLEKRFPDDPILDSAGLASVRRSLPQPVTPAQTLPAPLTAPSDSASNKDER
ncbi:MAG: hypothetical protein J0L78_10570 [Planctomycetes bacterium]|nr:hypothetical protein [Planctomycetota bacterium]